MLIDAPEELDLSHLRACGGLQPGEEELPDLPPAPGNADTVGMHILQCSTLLCLCAVPVELDEGVVAQLVSMGFGLEGCRRAVFHTHNQGVEPAMNWILEHMEDAGVCVCVWRRVGLTHCTGEQISWTLFTHPRPRKPPMLRLLQRLLPW